jgi:UDP-N-acetylmuramoylalanine--D-glutamate ligase
VSAAAERAGERLLLAGLGVMGRAVARALAARGVPFEAADDRPTAAHHDLAADLGFRFTGAPDAAGWAALAGRATTFLPTPGLPETHPAFAAAEAAGLQTVSEFDLAERWDERPVVAITGTNGKTTVTMMVTAMLRGAGRRAEAVGNTDVPLVAALDDPDTEVFVVEASSFRLGHSAHFRPAVGTWLNFAPDHLDVHRSLAGYEAAKARIWADQRADDVAVGNLADPVVARHLRSVAARQVGFDAGAVPAGRRGGYRVEDGVLVTDDDRPIVAVSELPRALPHDLANGLAAAATARSAGVALDAVADVLRTWAQLPHRVQLVGEQHGVRFYDDSKATTPHATEAALSGFASAVLIAGGQNKGIDLSPLASCAPRLRAVVAIGAAAEEVAAAFAGLRPVARADSMDAAVRVAADLAEAGDAVVLSPACASFDWYRNYGERGDDFARAVRDLIGTAGSGATAAVRTARGPDGPGSGTA